MHERRKGWIWFIFVSKAHVQKKAVDLYRVVNFV